MTSPSHGKIPVPEARGTGKPRILVAPLDWGLGHATRCIPVVRELLEQGCDVWLAGEGAARELLVTEFPNLPFLDLPGYRVRYARTAWGLFFSIIRQTHHILRAIRREHAWLKKMQAQYRFNAVIADNRYGLYHKEIPSIFITHQLRIKSPLGKWSENLLQKRNYRYINRFSECWVPDEEMGDTLAGELSHPVKKPVIPLYYTGTLSRFERQEMHIKPGHLLFILSGPEPQRSILEDRIIREISHYNNTVTLVRGLPGSASLLPSTNMLHMYNHITAAELEKQIAEAEFVISRCGYSTVMDMAVMQKKSILIPTPGQTEQEYLSRYLPEKQFACCITQESFTLNKTLTLARAFQYQFPVISEKGKLKQVMGRFVRSIKASL